MNMPFLILSAISKIEAAGFDVYAVGGCVRDNFMNKQPSDWDLATSALPQDIQTIFQSEKVIPTGIKHGTVTVLSQGQSVEITTFRIDGKYTDSRHPSDVTFSKDILQDLGRRDFTVNAMAYNPKSGLIDPFGGKSDLEHRIIRTVGSPKERFSEDALRIMRAIRFAATLNFEIEENTHTALFSCCDLLSDIAAERVAAELNKTLFAKNPAPTLAKYLPVMAKRLFGEDFRDQFKIDEKALLFESIGHTSPILSQRLALFLYCIGGDNITLARNFFTRLKYDAKTRHGVITILENIDTEICPDKVSIRKLLKKLGIASLSDILDVKFALANNDNRISLAYAKALLDEIVSRGDCCSLYQLDITGNDLKNVFGLSGTQIGIALDMLLDAVIEERCENKKDTLLNYLRNVSENIY